MSAVGGNADVACQGLSGPFKAKTRHGTTAAAGKRSLDLFKIRRLISLSQHLDKRGQVFLAIPRRDGTFEDTRNVVGKFAAYAGVAGLGLEALYALLPDPDACTRMKAAELEGVRMNDLGQLPDSMAFGIVGGKVIQADTFGLTEARAMGEADVPAKRPGKIRQVERRRGANLFADEPKISAKAPEKWLGSFKNRLRSGEQELHPPPRCRPGRDR